MPYNKFIFIVDIPGAPPRAGAIPAPPPPLPKKKKPAAGRHRTAAAPQRRSRCCTGSPAPPPPPPSPPAVPLPAKPAAAQPPPPPVDVAGFVAEVMVRVLEVERRRPIEVDMATSTLEDVRRSILDEFDDDQLPEGVKTGEVDFFFTVNNARIATLQEARKLPWQNGGTAGADQPQEVQANRCRTGRVRCTRGACGTRRASRRTRVNSDATSNAAATSS